MKDAMIFVLSIFLVGVILIALMSTSGCAAKMQFDKMQAMNHLSKLCDEGYYEACREIIGRNQF